MGSTTKLVIGEVTGSQSTGLAVQKEGGNVGIGTTTPSAPLHVYSNVSSNFAALIDNDQSSAGHVMKLTTDGTGNGSYVLDMESASSTIFRARADGRFGFGPDGVSSMGAGTFVVGIDNSSHTADIAISQRLQHLGDSNTYLDFPSADTFNLVAGGNSFLKYDSGNVLINNANADVDMKVMADDGSVILMTDASTNRVGIGTSTPGTQVQIEGSDPYLTIKNSTAENTDGGAETRIIFEDHSDTALAQIQASHDGTSDDTKGDLIFSTHDGTSLNEAMRINSNGNITVEKGLISSPSVLVNASGSPIVGQNWIKIARQNSDFSSGQTSQGIFLVTFVGREGVDDRGTKSTYIITVKFTATVNSPYYLASGTHITADAIDSGDLDGFDPANDLLITHEQDSTPAFEVWIRSRETHKHCYCTYLGGTNNVDNAAYSNQAPVIQVNQVSDTSITSLGNEIYGTWVEKTFSSLSLTTTEDGSDANPIITLKRYSSSPADADYLGQIKFQGENDASEEINYAKITGKIGDASDASEDGIIEFSNIKAGSQTITARLKSDSLQLLNGTSLSVNGVVQMDVQSGDPSTATDAGHIYTKDVGGSAEVFVQDEAGNVTQISPHNQKGEWQYFSKNVKTGKVVKINMEKMIRKLEQITGESFMEEWFENPEES